MRMWLVSPSSLCRQHLLGEHVEMHMFATAVRRGASLDGYLEKGLVIPSLIRLRHNQLVKEMRRRGYNHYSPLLPFFSNQLARYDRGSISIAENRAELRRRCVECRALQENEALTVEPSGVGRIR